MGFGGCTLVSFFGNLLRQDPGTTKGAGVVAILVVSQNLSNIRKT